MTKNRFLLSPASLKLILSTKLTYQVQIIFRTLKTTKVKILTRTSWSVNSGLYLKFWTGTYFSKHLWEAKHLKFDVKVYLNFAHWGKVSCISKPRYVIILQLDIDKILLGEAHQIPRARNTYYLTSQTISMVRITRMTWRTNDDILFRPKIKKSNYLLTMVLLVLVKKTSYNLLGYDDFQYFHKNSFRFHTLHFASKNPISITYQN